MNSKLGASVEIKLNIDDVRKIRKLANEMRRVADSGQELRFPNWKSVCRRTAGSLERLASHLSDFIQVDNNEHLETAVAENEGQAALSEDAKF